MEKNEMATEILKILERFAPEVDVEKVQPNQSLRDQFEIDSLDFVNFIIRLHEKFGVDIPEADYRQLRTLEEATEYIMRMQAKK